MRLLACHLVFNAGQHAELALDSDVELVSIFHNLLGQGHILVIRKSAAIDHHAGETKVAAALAQLKAVAVVEVKHDLRVLPAQLLGKLHGTLCHVAQQRLVGILASALRHLQDHRRLGVGCGSDDGLQLLHVVEIEGGDCITAIDGFLEHLARVHET